MFSASSRVTPASARKQTASMRDGLALPVPSATTRYPVAFALSSPYFSILW
jgi:hypothetical protein